MITFTRSPAHQEKEEGRRKQEAVEESPECLLESWRWRRIGQGNGNRKGCVDGNCREEEEEAYKTKEELKPTELTAKHRYSKKERRKKEQIPTHSNPKDLVYRLPPA